MKINDDDSITLILSPEEEVNSKLAARIIGKTEVQLRQRRMYGAMPSYVRIGKRAVRYRVGDLAEFVRRENGDVR